MIMGCKGSRRFISSCSSPLISYLEHAQMRSALKTFPRHQQTTGKWERMEVRRSQLVKLAKSFKGSGGNSGKICGGFSSGCHLEWFCPSQDTCQGLETFLVVTTGGMLLAWSPQKPAHHAQGAPSQYGMIQTQMAKVLRLGNPESEPEKTEIYLTKRILFFENYAHVEAGDL